MSRNCGLRALRGTRGVAFAPVALLLAALTLTALAPGPSVAEDVVSAAAKAQAAYFAGNAAELGKLAASTSTWSGSANAAEAYAHAYVQFRALQLAISGSRKKDATAAGEACITATDAAARRDPKLADAFVLQSACYGYLANLGGFAAIGNGRRCGKAMDAALAIGAPTARVALVGAFGLYFRPKIAGGDKTKGCTQFKDAAAAFDASAAPPRAAPSIDWGAAEAHFWSGRCASDAGDAAGARRGFERALALAPDFLAARRRLGL